MSQDFVVPLKNYRANRQYCLVEYFLFAFLEYFEEMVFETIAQRATDSFCEGDFAKVAVAFDEIGVMYPHDRMIAE